MERTERYRSGSAARTVEASQSPDVPKQRAVASVAAVKQTDNRVSAQSKSAAQSKINAQSVQSNVAAQGKTSALAGREQSMEKRRQLQEQMEREENASFNKSLTVADKFSSPTRGSVKKTSTDVARGNARLDEDEDQTD